jgi:hypothetical protein
MNHEVQNQPPPLGDIDLFSSDRALREAVEREGAGWASSELAGTLAALDARWPRQCVSLAAAETERFAVALQASLLIRFSPAAVADAFCESRLEGDGGRAFGTLPPRVDFQAVIGLA